MKVDGSFSSKGMSTIATTSGGTASVDSSTTQRLLPRPSVPRAVVLHGTTCYYRNESLTFHKRDINTIFIGRYMVEREGFQSGFSNDEFYLAHCSALVKTYMPWLRCLYFQISLTLLLYNKSVRNLTPLSLCSQL